MLRDVREWMKVHRAASLYELSVHFDTPEAAMAGMMAILEQKGMVRRGGTACGTGGGCGKTCGGCTTGELYLWTGAADRTAAA